uniref:Protein kinase domain-containing protein n=1 Tax=Thermogemmatispora argillosa TaxID=2045280 RepID=A0A455SY68_9CHLR|nr:hypothetical protein KTA_03100 [Thermogemmatispora argillosa]
MMTAPRQLGCSRLIRLLGEGGFSSLSLGEHVILGPQAAVKRPKRRLNPDDLAAFRREAQLLARLSSPYLHILHALDDDEAGQPLLGGETCVRRGLLSLPGAFSVSRARSPWPCC